jgi:hypothetical protein
MFEPKWVQKTFLLAAGSVILGTLRAEMNRKPRPDTSGTPGRTIHHSSESLSCDPGCNFDKCVYERV